jgi:hypothetical protein
MKRKTKLRLAVGILSALATPIVAQTAPANPPELPDLVGQQLIVWSETEKPQPIPQHTPEPNQSQAPQQPDPPAQTPGNASSDINHANSN